ncbi:MAG: mevalonate kinase [Anaerolineae bacterium]|jgi:mevalonate kinase|nr:mevalonate kinase [Anaerolineae bacterium]MDX9831177.1 mevalonate kinase [Anaerolineae bacterium]
MSMTIAQAPGKVILFGEHAVVYGRPAIAVPVTEVKAEAQVEPGERGQGTVIVASDMGQRIVLREAGDGEALAHLVRLVLKRLRAGRDPDLTITVTSTVPIARGMGSGAAVATAIARALIKHLGHWAASRTISDLVYQSEVLYHGTPSGIDNTVVAFEKPIYFVKDEGWEVFWLAKPLLLAIGDTGIESSTREVVGDLRQRAAADPGRYEALFDQVADVTRAARTALELGQQEATGRLMDENHALLQELDVSCPALDQLVIAAREGGALGAKLSGAGRGGNMVALVTQETRGAVDMMLRLAGAANVTVTEVR